MINYKNFILSKWTAIVFAVLGLVHCALLIQSAVPFVGRQMSKEDFMRTYLESVDQAESLEYIDNAERAWTTYQIIASDWNLLTYPIIGVIMYAVLFIGAVKESPKLLFLWLVFGFLSLLYTFSMAVVSHLYLAPLPGSHFHVELWIELFVKSLLVAIMFNYRKNVLLYYSGFKEFQNM